MVSLNIAEAGTVAVSVIIPTFNRGQFIGEAIASIIAQSFADWEAIIVDDGSTDNTEQVVRAIEDPRIHYIKQRNTGRSHARNQALGAARGRYIAFLDSDDLYLPEKLSLQVAYMDAHPEVGMVYTSAHCMDSTGNFLPQKYIASVSGNIYQSVAFFVPVTITLPTVMFRRELLKVVGGFDEKMHRFEDTDMWRRLSKNTFVYAMPEFTCHLRTHDDNCLLNQNPDHIVEALRYYADKIWHEDADMGYFVRRRGIANLYCYYSRAFLSVRMWRHYGISLTLKALYWWPPLVWRLLVRAAISACVNKAYRFYKTLRPSI